MPRTCKISIISLKIIGKILIGGLEGDGGGAGRSLIKISKWTLVDVGVKKWPLFCGLHKWMTPKVKQNVFEIFKLRIWEEDIQRCPEKEILKPT